MSKPKGLQELASNLNTLLEKHEVHNEMLAIELAIFVLQREKTVIKARHQEFQRTMDKMDRKSKALLKED